MSTKTFCHQQSCLRWLAQVLMKVGCHTGCPSFPLPIVTNAPAHLCVTKRVYQIILRIYSFGNRYDVHVQSYVFGLMSYSEWFLKMDAMYQKYAMNIHAHIYHTYACVTWWASYSYYIGYHYNAVWNLYWIQLFWLTEAKHKPQV